MPTGIGPRGQLQFERRTLRASEIAALEQIEKQIKGKTMTNTDRLAQALRDILAVSSDGFFVSAMNFDLRDAADKALAEHDAALASLAPAAVEGNAELGYARRILDSLHAHFYPNSGLKVLPTLDGILSQIDNIVSQLPAQVATLTAQCEGLTKQNRILEIKNAGTLANNLCPDHRDKQIGKPCLACTIETLQRKLDSAIAAGNGEGV